MSQLNATANNRKVALSITVTRTHSNKQRINFGHRVKEQPTTKVEPACELRGERRSERYKVGIRSKVLFYLSKHTHTSNRKIIELKSPQTLKLNIIEYGRYNLPHLWSSLPPLLIYSLICSIDFVPFPFSTRIINLSSEFNSLTAFNELYSA